ncbi:MAG: hypothetical protein ACO1OQ_03390, partial [Rufibacter sp.]
MQVKEIWFENKENLGRCRVVAALRPLKRRNSLAQVPPLIRELSFPVFGLFSENEAENNRNTASPVPLPLPSSCSQRRLPLLFKKDPARVFGLF